MTRVIFVIYNNHNLTTQTNAQFEKLWRAGTTRDWFGGNELYNLYETVPHFGGKNEGTHKPTLCQDLQLPTNDERHSTHTNTHTRVTSLTAVFFDGGRSNVTPPQRLLLEH